MSHRANYAVRNQGRTRFAANRQGGTGVPDVLFGGTDTVRAYLDDEAPLDTDRLYDETACEGLILLDYDERVVLFEGVSELMFEGAMRRVWGPLLESVWSG